MKIGSLCSGYGGLDMGVQAVLGGEVAWVSDIDPGANKILAHRHPDVPNLGDFTVTDWSTVEPVDVLTAGFPCQPVSHAGKQLGDLDERWLWDDVARAVRDLRPGLVVLENVRGLLSAGGGRLFGRVLGTLAELGYDAQWHGLRAADVGAPHGRWRVFIVASPVGHAPSLGRQWGQAQLAGALDQPAGDGARGLLPTPRSSDTNGAGVHGDGGLDLRTVVSLLPTPTCTQRGTDANLDEREGARANLHNEVAAIGQEWGDYAPAIARWEAVLGRPAPAPTEPGPKGSPRLSPAFVEWMMGLPEGHVTDVPGLTRNHQLKALGNGVVPQQAAVALRLMLASEVAA